MQGQEAALKSAAFVSGGKQWGSKRNLAVTGPQKERACLTQGLEHFVKRNTFSVRGCYQDFPKSQFPPYFGASETNQLSDSMIMTAKTFTSGVRCPSVWKTVSSVVKLLLSVPQPRFRTPKKSCLCGTVSLQFSHLCVPLALRCVVPNKCLWYGFW